jgi:carotenoid cleavage dioxygenase-like enzyme
VILVALDAPHEIVRFRVPPIVVLHWANAWDEGARITALAPVGSDMPRTWRWLESLASGGSAPRPEVHPHRLEIDPVARSIRLDRIGHEPGEQPRIDPRVEQRPSRFVYYAGFTREEGPTDRVLKLDVANGRTETIAFGDGVQPSEAVFVPRPESREEDDGWLLSLVYDPSTDRSHLAVADARRPDDAPIARCHFDQHVPPPFHGTWVS